MIRLLKILLLATALMLPAWAFASDCAVSGTIAATRNPDPQGPEWQYTAVIQWDTGTRYALSHLTMLLDIAGGTCSCANFQSALTWGYPIGTSGTACVASYWGELNCQGDPSIPGASGIALKLNPISGACEPGTAGTGTFVFMSDLAPAQIDEDALTMIDKYGQKFCWGHLSGQFPAMPCNPVSGEISPWGSVKGMYR
jgi:hypothetical protein